MLGLAQLPSVLISLVLAVVHRFVARATQRGRRLLVSQTSGAPLRRGKELVFAGRQEVRFR